MSKTRTRQAQTPAKVAPKITAPKKRVIYSLTDFANLKKSTILHFVGSPTQLDEEGTVWLALGHVKYSAIEDSVVVLGHNAESLAFALPFILQKTYLRMVKPEEYEKSPLVVDEMGGIITPYLQTPLYTPVERCVTDLCAYILSRCGRVVAVNVNGETVTTVSEDWFIEDSAGGLAILKPGITPVTEPISFEEVRDYLKFQQLLETFEDGGSIFSEILRISGLMDPHAVEKDVEIELATATTPEEVEEAEQNNAALQALKDQSKN
jgi:hypothetical protein